MSTSKLHVYNSLTRSLEPFRTAEPGKVRMYVCGMTTYDYCHIGHARAMLTFDVVYRYLRWRGYEVTYVRNYTDVDDKIIARAAELGEEPLALSGRFIEALDEDLDRLGLAHPQVQPKVSTHVPQIIDMVSRLIERGHAYATDSGDVWFSVESFEGYGQLSGKKLDDLRAGERVAVAEGKRHPGDFALWKSAKEGEISWESPWGQGRPGWHIECSVMSVEHLGESFDIHGGGIDLIFPHHENEIAQSECATGAHPFARYWLHNGHLTIETGEDGGTEKMSKSLGNVRNIRDILDEVPAEALRLLYLDAHYRSPLPYSAARLTSAVSGLNRIYEAKETAQDIAAKGGHQSAAELVREWGADAQRLHELALGFPEAFRAAMDQDFNTAQVLGHLFELVRAINRLANDKRARERGAPLFQQALGAFELTGEVLGVGGSDPTALFDELKAKRLSTQGLSVDEVELKLEERARARAEKDWVLADALRDELDAMGIVVMDSPQGVTWRIRVD